MVEKKTFILHIYILNSFAKEIYIIIYFKIFFITYFFDHFKKYSLISLL